MAKNGEWIASKGRELQKALWHILRATTSLLIFINLKKVHAGAAGVFCIYLIGEMSSKCFRAMAVFVHINYGDSRGF